jgi:hypothetical protein
MWRETIQKTVLTRLTNPYMRACLVFLGSLTDQNDSAEERLGMNLYRTILFEKEIDLAVRAAFALSFLSDEDLYVFTQNVTNVCSRNGYLEGLLLTGLNTSAGVAILQSHLNRTGDVQTVALLSCYFQGVVDNADDLKTLENWIDTYKDLLNRWRMFETRAHFQIARKELLHSIADQTGLESARAAARVRPQVVARCTFCGGSLSLKNLSTSSRPGGQFSSRGAKTKITLGQASSTVANTRVRGCPRCKKVLPRCSICLVTLDVAVPKARQSSQCLLQRGGRNAPSDKKTKLLLSPEHNSHVHKSKADSSSHAFGQWFTWCQKCRHGGHAGHIDEWFQDHKTCPVTNCDCACNTLDYLG